MKTILTEGSYNLEEEAPKKRTRAKKTVEASNEAE